MLGDLFYEAKGRISSKRVLDLKGPKIESSYFLEGKMRGEIEVVRDRNVCQDSNLGWCLLCRRQGYCNC